MNIKYFNFILISMVMFVFNTALPVFAYKIDKSPEVSFVMQKFLTAMLGVFIFSLILYLGLSIYNRFFVSEQIKDFKLRQDSLRPPRDKQEAITMFIAKNRLK